MAKVKIGIDASRNRSGGAKAHIIGILKTIEKEVLEKNLEIHVWSYDELLGQLPSANWLVKHSPEALKKSILHQVKWQFFNLHKEAKSSQIDIMLNTDAGSVARFKPAITMSRDMLSYEEGEMKRFGLSLQRLRLILLKYMQNNSLRKSTAAIFLTKYAADTIQQSSGKIKEYRIIPHGTSDNFRMNLQNKKTLVNDTINCIYVSNVDFYKHQDSVAKAIHALRKEKNYDINIEFVGGGQGEAQKNFVELMDQLDPKREFINQQTFVEHKLLPGIIGKADIFIFASSCENMPNTLLEGMCSSLPIACAKRGPMPEILKEAGVYFDPENVTSIVDALEKLITDDKLRLEKALESKQISNQYSWTRCGHETINYLLEIQKKQNIKK